MIPCSKRSPEQFWKRYHLLSYCADIFGESVTRNRKSWGDMCYEYIFRFNVDECMLRVRKVIFWTALFPSLYLWYILNFICKLSRSHHYSSELVKPTSFPNPILPRCVQSFSNHTPNSPALLSSNDILTCFSKKAPLRWPHWNNYLFSSTDTVYQNTFGRLR